MLKSNNLREYYWVKVLNTSISHKRAFILQIIYIKYTFISWARNSFFIMYYVKN